MKTTLSTGAERRFVPTSRAQSGSPSAHEGAERVVERLRHGEGGEAARDDLPGRAERLVEGRLREGGALVDDDLRVAGQHAGGDEAHRDHRLRVQPARAPRRCGVVGELDGRERDPDQVGAARDRLVDPRDDDDPVRRDLRGADDPT
jgi:hypothetical protein